MCLSKWLKKQKVWLQIAAEKIIKNSQLDENDFDELVKLCIKEAEGTIDIPKPNIFDKTHISEKINSSRLCSIRDIQGINALAPRKPLDFGNGNISIIYGENASENLVMYDFLNIFAAHV